MGGMDLNVAIRSRAPAKRSGAILIGVASDDFHTISGRAGKCRRFLVFDAEKGKAPREPERLEFRRELSIRDFSGNGPHPLDIVQVLIIGDAGPGIIGWMSARGIEVVRTSESDPVAAVVKHLRGNLRPTKVADFGRSEGGAEAAEFLKAMANETRLAILCVLAQGEKSVSELERTLELHQARVSQAVARLRHAGLVRSRTAGSNVFYSLANARVSTMIAALYEMYCAQHK
jgi:DNA-binding transcriptional ArsR family regulator